MGFEMDESNTTIYQVTNSNENKVWFDPFLYCFYWWQSHYAKDGDDEDEDDDDDVDDVDDDDAGAGAGADDGDIEDDGDDEWKYNHTKRSSIFDIPIIEPTRICFLACAAKFMAFYNGL